MIVVTATLVFVALIFAPIRLKIDVFLYLQDLSATIWAKTLAVKVFDEDISLHGKYLHCEGTVATDVDLSKVNRKHGIDLLKCITVDKLCVSLQNDILSVSTFAVALQNAVMALATATLCNLYHCQFYTQVVGCLDKSKVHAQVFASANVAELSFCLLKQGVEQWKMRKLER